MKYNEIFEKVKAYMDEVGPIDGGLILDDDTEKPLDALIASVLESAWKSFVLLCPLHLLTSKAGTSVAASNHIASIPIPTDFIRLASVKMASWSHDLYELHPAIGNLYAMQHNEFTMGTPTRPIAFIKHGVIECYSGTGATESTSFKYIAKKTFNPESEEDLIEDLVSHAFCYHVAGNVYDSLGNKLSQVAYTNRDRLFM